MMPSPAEVEAAALARLRRWGGTILLKEDYDAAGTNLFLDMNYEQVVDLDLGGRTKQLLGRRSPKACRYCQKIARQRRFSRSHAIPESVGNRRLISLDECDRCNERFSQTFEHHFDAFLRRCAPHLRSAARRAFPPINRPTERQGSHSTATQEFQHNGGRKGAIVTVDESGKALIMTMKSDPHVPLEVYRCLVKMGFAVLPEGELKHFDLTRKWLTEPLAPPSPLLASFAFSHLAYLPAALTARMLRCGEGGMRHSRRPTCWRRWGFRSAASCTRFLCRPRTGTWPLAGFLVPTFDLTLNLAFANAAWQTIGLAPRDGNIRGAQHPYQLRQHRGSRLRGTRKESIS